MSHVVDVDLKIRSIKVVRPKVARLTEEDMHANPEKVASIINDLNDAVDDLYAIGPLDYTDFEDLACPGNPGTVTLRHGYNQRVRWQVLEWNSNGSVWILDASHYFVGPSLSKNAASDSNTLVLDSYFAGTATIRVFPRGA